MSNLLLAILLSFGIIAGSKATTDGYVYLGHNVDLCGEKMLNIYNVPPSKNGMAGLWFEFPGRIDDSYVNENGVCIASHETPSMENDREGRHLYKLQTKAFRKATILLPKKLKISFLQMDLKKSCCVLSAVLVTKKKM